VTASPPEAGLPAQERRSATADPPLWQVRPFGGRRDEEAALDPLGHYWTLAGPDALDALGAREEGLTAGEAQFRLSRLGPNSLVAGEGGRILPLLRRQFTSPLVLILLAGAAISLLLRDWSDAAIIMAIVLGSALLGFAQEYRASRAVAALRDRLALTCTVLGDGAEVIVPATEIVPGDLVHLAAGNLVPADGIVMEACDCMVAEAALTGESFPVEKRPGVTAVDAPLAERRNALFSGSSLRSGTATLLVVHTGAATEYGAIAARLAGRAPETDFERGVRRFGDLLLRAMFLIVLFVLAANHLLGRPFTESLLFAVALAVGLSPELLPAIVSITLAKGARAMARSGVIVRRLQAIEMLGSLDVICTDKTGTITSGEVTLAQAVDLAGEADPAILHLAFINASLETGIANPLDDALVRAGTSAGLSADPTLKIAEIPYDFSRRRLTLVVAEPDGQHHRLIAKGAVAEMLAICTSARLGGREEPLSDGQRNNCLKYLEQQGARGFRVLAIAHRIVPAQPSYSAADEAEMILDGFLLFADPPKPGVRETLEALAELGIAVKIITGDNRHVAAHVAEAVGLGQASLLTGMQIAQMRDEALWHAAERTTLFVEIDPQQKDRIVRALQHRGHAVGFLGDGINDAPALHSADVGISVESAADVARESADIVLLTADLDVLRRGVIDGRRTFANTMKYISITTSANFGNMLSMALAVPLLPFLPLLPKQILLNNFLSDLPSMAISTDRVDAERMAMPQRWSIGQIARFMILFGSVSSLFDGLTFLLLLTVLHAGEVEFHTVWFVVSLLTELAVVLVLRTWRPAWRSRPAPLLVWSTLAVSAAALALPFVPPMQQAFGFVRPDWKAVTIMLAIVGAYIAVTEAVKLGLAKRFGASTSPPDQGGKIDGE